MKLKNKKCFCVLLLAGCILLGYFLWLSLRPVEIVAVHQKKDSSDVLVKNFPFTDKGKISWWLKNKNMLKEKYNIPQPAGDGDFSVYFWLFGDGYKETDGYDRLCFDDMKAKINCIDKNATFSVENGRGSDILFTVYDGTYRMKENGELIKIKYE